MYQINFSKTASFETQHYEKPNPDATSDNRFEHTRYSVEPLAIQHCADEEHSAAYHDDCEDTRRSPDKRRTLNEMREKINNLKKQIWYNWNYWDLAASIKEGEVKVVGTAEYNKVEYPEKFDYIDDKTWTVFQAAARKLEEEFGSELEAIPDDIDRAYLEGKLSALRYACGEEDWEHLYA